MPFSIPPTSAPATLVGLGAPVAAVVIATAAVAVVAAAAPLAVLHVALGHAMRARGVHPRWHLRDTLLVSPLLALGLLVGFGALAHGLVRLVADSSAGVAAWPHAVVCALVAVGAFVVAGFGVRAVGKLY